MTSPPAGPSSYRVYEAVNHTTGEALVSFSSDPLPDIREDVKRHPPKPFSHWSAAHKIEFRIVSGPLGLDKAISWARDHHKCERLAAYKTVLLE